MESEDVVEALREFVAQRDWSQFHSPENFAKSISIEAAELLECFQWNNDFDREAVIDELADVLTYCLMFADHLGVDAGNIVMKKLAETASKYPVNKARGRSEKYDRL
jgi:dCTP diphosphatase